METNNSPFVFIRDDDVWRLDESFLRFFRYCLNSKIPVVYAVIPAKATKELLNFLAEQKKRNPNLLDIVQHGWNHQNHNKYAPSKYEFGKNRSFAQQKEDIVNGLLKLYIHFGDAFTPAFVPPYHGFNSDTLEILKQFNFPVFSCSEGATPKIEGITNIPAKINLTKFSQGKPLLVSSPEIKKLILHKLKTSHILTVLAHHDNYNELSFNKLKETMLFLKKLNSNKAIKFSSFSALTRSLGIKFPHIELTLQITNKCNLKCQACSIWKENEHNLSLNNIIRYLNRVIDKFKIEHVAVTGGEPFLHPQISQIFDFLAYLKNKKTIEEIGIYSNGYHTGKIAAFLKANRNKLNGLILGISIDGVEKTHDFLRGKTGVYEKTTKTIKTIKKNFPNVKVKIKFTISPYNYNEILQIFDFCRKNGLELSPKFIEVESGFYYNKKASSPLAERSFSKLEKNKILNTFKKISKIQDNAKIKVIDPKIILALTNYLKHGKKSIERCLTPFKSLFLNNLGGIQPCVYKEAIGNVSELEIENCLKGEKHRELITQALNGDCPKCLAYHGFLKRFNL